MYLLRPAPQPLLPRAPFGWASPALSFATAKRSELFLKWTAPEQTVCSYFSSMAALHRTLWAGSRLNHPFSAKCTATCLKVTDSCSLADKARASCQDWIFGKREVIVCAVWWPSQAKPSPLLSFNFYFRSKGSGAGERGVHLSDKGFQRSPGWVSSISRK